MMNKEQILQMTYISVLADIVTQMGNQGCLEGITESKKEMQMLSGKRNADFMGISTPEEVFTRLSDIFNCVEWKIIKNTSGFSAEASSCKLCSFTKQMGPHSPCELYCLNPMEGMIKALDSKLKFNVKEKLWDGEKCLIEVSE
jgi:hypothetical protein